MKRRYASRFKWLLVLCASLALTGAVVAGCGSSSSDSTGKTASGGDSSEFMAEAHAQLESLYDGGTYVLPKGKSPTPAKNKVIWVVSIGQSAEIVALAINGLEKAGQNFNWKIHVFDGKFEPNLWLTGIRDAVAAKADAIWLANIDCTPVKAAVEEAENAGIPVVINSGRDCVEGKYEPATYIARYETKYDDGKISKGEGTLVEWAKSMGAVGGWWIAVDQKGEAKTIQLSETDAQTAVAEAEGSEDVINKCPGCEVLEKINFVGTELGPQLSAKVQQALTQHPEATALHPDYDATLTSGVAGAARASGVDPTLISGEGTAPIVEMAREEELGGGNGIDALWEGWCGADEFIYVFAHKTPRACGLGVAAWDPQHNMPPEGQGFTSGMPFEQAYLSSWGVK